MQKRGSREEAVNVPALEAVQPVKSKLASRTLAGVQRQKQGASKAHKSPRLVLLRHSLPQKNKNGHMRKKRLAEMPLNAL